MLMNCIELSNFVAQNCERSLPKKQYPAFLQMDRTAAIDSLSCGLVHREAVVPGLPGHEVHHGQPLGAVRAAARGRSAAPGARPGLGGE